MPDLDKRDTATEIRGAVEKYFKKEKIKHRPFDKKGVAHATYAVQTKFGHVEVLFYVYKDMLIFHLSKLPVQQMFIKSGVRLLALRQ